MICDVPIAVMSASGLPQAGLRKRDTKLRGLKCQIFKRSERRRQKTALPRQGRGDWRRGGWLFHPVSPSKIWLENFVLPEGDELASGSSWHAAGQIHIISSDPKFSRLQGYTIDLYKEIEET